MRVGTAYGNQKSLWKPERPMGAGGPIELERSMEAGTAYGNRKCLWKLERPMEAGAAYGSRSTPYPLSASNPAAPMSCALSYRTFRTWAGVSSGDFVRMAATAPVTWAVA